MAKKKPEEAKPQESTGPPEPPVMSANVMLYHRTGAYATITVVGGGAGHLSALVDSLFDVGFSLERPEPVKPEVKPEPMTKERLDAAAKTAAEMADADAEAEKQKRIETAKAVMEEAKKPVADNGKPTEAEKKRVAALLAEWRMFLSHDGGPTAGEMTAKTRELMKNESRPVVTYIRDKAINAWKEDTGFEWSEERQEWAAPKGPDEPMGW